MATEDGCSAQFCSKDLALPALLEGVLKDAATDTSQMGGGRRPRVASVGSSSGVRVTLITDVLHAMPKELQSVAKAEPFKVLKGADETDGAFVRFVATLYPASDELEAASSLTHRRWAADNADEHLHPNQEETFRVRSGAYRIVVDDFECTLTEGEEMTLPRNTPHRHYNPTDRPARVVKEDRPARNSEAFFSALYALAQAGRTDDDGFPSVLEFAVIQDEYPGHAYMADLSVDVQKRLFTLLAPMGRLLGYRADPPLVGAIPREN